MTGEDSARAQQLRHRLVETVARRTGASRRVLDVIARTPRHWFMPDHVSLEDAYHDGAYPIGEGQTISQPTVVAMMTEGLELTGQERVLEVGTGSGYQAAILAPLCAELYSIERIGSLSGRAAEVLEKIGCDNVHLRVGDGYRGWPEAAPFDRIILTAAPPSVPRPLLDQLAEGGFMLAPVGERFDQRLLRIHLDNGQVRQETLSAVAFVPMVPGDPSN